MKYQIGQEIVIRRTVGGRYRYGGSVRDVPLGSKGKIEEIRREDQLYVRFKNIGWSVHPEEIALSEDYVKKEKEREEKMSSLLEETVIKEEVLEEPSEEKIEIEKEIEGPRGFIEGIKRFFGYGQQPTNTQKIYGKPFKPKFNVREEFAVWVRGEFPELEKYACNGEEYEELNMRRKEVYKAAKKACEHGVRTTDSCVQDQFERYLRRLEDKGKFKNNVLDIVKFIERVSANLNRGTLHYGTLLASGERIR